MASIAGAVYWGRRPIVTRRLFGRGSDHWYVPARLHIARHLSARHRDDGDGLRARAPSMRSAIFSDRRVFPHEPALRALARRSSVHRHGCPYDDRGALQIARDARARGASCRNCDRISSRRPHPPVLCIHRVPGCRQRGAARPVLGIAGSVTAVASVVMGAHEPAAGARRNRPVADRRRRLGTRPPDDRCVRGHIGAVRERSRCRAPAPAARLGPILSELVPRATVAPGRADRHWRLAVDASPFPV